MKQTLLHNGRRITYYRSDTVRPVALVLLHGFCEDASVWDGLLSDLNDLHPVRIDLPGFGGSDPSPSNDFDAWADDVCAVLNDLSAKTCVLIGHSMGGYTALSFAKRYPERLAGFGLFHSHPYEDTPDRKESRRRGIEMLQSGKRDLYVAQLFPGLFAEAFVKTNPAVIETLIARGRQQPATSITGALESMIARKDHRDTLRDAACPVLFVLGSDDAIIPVDWALQAAVLPAVTDVHVLPGVGHMAMFEAPEKSVEIVRQFWEFCAAR